MNPTLPLTLRDLNLFFATAAIVLLVTSEVISPYYGKANMKVNRKRLRNAAITTSILFLITVALRILKINLPFLG
jgi:hypothetical protein